MKVSTKGRYALRIMIDLAEHNTGGYIRLKDISKRQGITLKYMEQIMPILTKSGYVKSFRGNNGGYMLAKRPEEYTAGEILRAAEGSLAPVGCIEDEPNACGHYEQCRTVKFWEGLWDVIIEYTDRFTLADLMKKCVEEGSRIITLDCITQEDLDLIADAVITSGLKVIAVDPGVFTATLSRKLITPNKKKQKTKILAVVGSVNANTTAQMEELWLSQRTHNEFVHTRELLEGEKRRELEIRRVVNSILGECDRNNISTVTGDGIYPENRIDFTPYMERYQCSLDEVTEMINSGFAEITYRIFKAEDTFKGLYTSGGDITVAVCKKFDTAGLSLLDEVLPLAAYGQFLKGEFEGVHIITKGGSQGNKDAINKCITYLKEKLYI